LPKRIGNRLSRPNVNRVNRVNPTMSIIKEQSSDDEPVNKKEQETPKESSPEKKDIEKA